MNQLKYILVFLACFALNASGQNELLPSVAWRTNITNVIMLTDSTYQVDVDPIDYNEPGAIQRTIGNYLKDFIGHTYQIIDSTSTNITVLDKFNSGIGPQTDRIGIVYRSVGGGQSPYLAPIYYNHLDNSAFDYSRQIELEVLWKEAKLYANDSINLVWFKDTVSSIATKYDIETITETDPVFTAWDKNYFDLINLPNIRDSVETYSYTHPTGFTNQPETALTGGNVISQITVSDEGHVEGVTSRGLTTTDITEGTNQYYTNARARQSISLTTAGSSGASTYSNSTGVLNVPNYTLSGLGFTYPGAGIPVSTGSAWGTSITDNSANWNTAFGWGDFRVFGLGVTNPSGVANMNDLTGAQFGAFGLVSGDNSPPGADAGRGGYIQMTRLGTPDRFQIAVDLQGNIFSRGRNSGVWGTWRTIRHDGNFVAGTHYQTPITNPVTGTGTTNYLTKWSGVGSGIINSTIFESGSNVGVNNTSPAYRLDVGGVGRYTTTGTSIQPALYIKNNTSFVTNRGVGLFLTASTDMELASLSSRWGANDTESYFSIHVRSGSALTERIRVLADGSMAIANTAPTERLDVSGNARFRAIGTTTATSVLGATSTGVLTTNTGISTTSGILSYTAERTFNNARQIVDKAYVDAIASGNMPKLPVDAATTANITLSGTQTIDGFAVTAGMRVLVKNQTTASQNGVYVVASGAWSRASDLNTWGSLFKAYVAVLNGTQSGSSWVCTIPESGTLGTTAVTWVLYSAPTNIEPLTPLARTGNELKLKYSLLTLDLTGDSLRVKPNVFAPFTHTHTVSNITDFPTTWDYSNITNVPSTFAPSSHTLGSHSNVSSGVDASQSTGDILRWSGSAWDKWTPNYLTTETDPIFNAHLASSITSSDTTRWGSVTDLSGYVPTSRTLTINGTTQSLAANRTFNVGTVTSIAAGTGLSGGTITGSGTISANFGTTAGTVAQGNDSRINNGQTAFGWGNHATSGYITGITKSMVEAVLTGNITSHTHNYISTSHTTNSIANGTGFLKNNGSGVWSYDNNTYLTGNQTITLTGDVTGSGTTSIAATLANSGVTAGTYNNSATQVRPFTVDAKGRITNIGTAVTITPAMSSVTGLIDALDGKQSNTLNNTQVFIGNSSNTAQARSLSLNATAGAFGLSNSGVLTFPDATSSTRGFLSSADWTTFNNKSNLALGETSSTAYRGDRGKTAYDHSQVTTGSVHGSSTVGTLLLRIPNNSSTNKIIRVNANNTIEYRTAGELRTEIEAEPIFDKGNVTQGTGIALSGTAAGRLVNTGDLQVGLTGQALALHNLSTNGIIARTGAGTVSARTITGTTNQVTVTNGNGVSGNPTLSLPQNIHTAATPTFAGATINGNVGIRAAASSSTATQIPVFTANPASTTRTLVTRTPAQFRGDIGAAATTDLHTHTNKALLDAITASDTTRWGSVTDLSGYVPYTGATTNLNLGIRNISTNSMILTGYLNQDMTIGMSNLDMYFEAATGGKFYFRPNGTGSNTGIVAMTTTGLGIGITTNSTEALDVNGNARFRSIGTTAATNLLGANGDGVLTTNVNGILSAYKLKSDSTATDGYVRRDRLTSSLATKENAFTKNTAFNKNFGTTAGTVLEGRTFGTAANSAVGDFATASHTHGNISNAGAIGTAANLPIITNASGVLNTTTVSNFKSLLSLTKSDVGLSNVDNTSDASKPISSATQTALDEKQNTMSGGHAISIAGSEINLDINKQNELTSAISQTYYYLPIHASSNNTRWRISTRQLTSMIIDKTVHAPSPSNNQVLQFNSTNDRWELASLTTGGTVTSVGLAMPNIFSVSGTPVTSSGTLTASLANQNPNRVFAGPASGAAGAPTFRWLEFEDIPLLNASIVTAGVFNTARLGTGTADETTFLRGDGTWAQAGGLWSSDTNGISYTGNVGIGGASTSSYRLSLTNTTAMGLLYLSSTNSLSHGIGIRAGGDIANALSIMPAAGPSNTFEIRGDGVMSIINRTTNPTISTGYGSYYVLNGKPYFRYGTGTAIDLSDTGSGGSTTFTGLTDTPANYTGHGGKLVGVNSGATGLEFVTISPSKWQSATGWVAPSNINDAVRIGSTDNYSGSKLSVKGNSWFDGNVVFSGATNIFANGFVIHKKTTHRAGSSTHISIYSVGDTIQGGGVDNGKVFARAGHEPNNSTMYDLTGTRTFTAPNNQNFAISLNDYVHARCSTNTNITIGIDWPKEGKSGNIEVVYTGNSVVTFTAPLAMTIYIASNIYNTTTNNYTKSVTSKGNGQRAVYSYHISGNNIYINGTQDYN